MQITFAAMPPPCVYREIDDVGGDCTIGQGADKPDDDPVFDCDQGWPGVSPRG